MQQVNKRIKTNIERETFKYCLYAVCIVAFFVSFDLLIGNIIPHFPNIFDCAKYLHIKRQKLMRNWKHRVRIQLIISINKPSKWYCKSLWVNFTQWRRRSGAISGKNLHYSTPFPFTGSPLIKGNKMSLKPQRKTNQLTRQATQCDPQTPEWKPKNWTRTQFP